MAVKTTQEQLEEVQAAITKVLNTQSYTIGDASIQRARLKDLEAREQRLKSDLAKENATNPTVSQAYFGNAGD